ncbi:unnamed protein product [Prunus armeniaca]
MEQQMQSRRGGNRICYSGANAKERGGRRDPSHGRERDRRCSFFSNGKPGCGFDWLGFGGAKKRPSRDRR